MAATLLLAIALMLIIEGIFPFVSPTLWLNTFRKITQLPPAQVRLGGLIAIGLGLLLLMLAG
ncbi:DUF2065 domain-containing protein [Mycetohabitans sp. B5]|uniref:DUF2065 domain-containing protein n=1 Tax=Mycetohabitans endofungorum TaxID=417203 RepID=A0A2P5KBM3_9BURK|nr:MULTISPECIES: DUF2065 domain-containing protein [Mycetohabitans]MCG1054382.1 DUF2065 domain-containing protein [Mycetohabitans sp. B5]PPB84091.1 hypothetical protein B0O95_10441 [Mycetohabitans endofungorum]